MTLIAGATVGRYTILEPLGQGGMATVYKAFQPSLQREVALKVLRPGYAHDQEFLERFEREAIAVARLRHAHIVQVFDFETADGQYVLAMELLEGGTLKERLAQLASRGRGMDPNETVRIIGEVARALAYAHEKGIVHRDVKPSNVMLTEKDRAVVTDFGIARILGATSHTQTGVGIGTPEYMAPEQGMGSKVDHRADIYSLGAMTYEMLTGRVPFVADTPLAVVLAHVKDPLPLPSAVNPTIGPAVEKVLLKALAKDPEHRFATATDLAEGLNEALAADTATGTMPTIVVRPTSVTAAGAAIGLPAALTTIRSAARRSPGLTALAAGAALLVLVGATTVVGSLTTAAPSPTDPARAPLAAAASDDAAAAEPSARPTTVARDVQVTPAASQPIATTAAPTTVPTAEPQARTADPTAPTRTQASAVTSAPASTPTLPPATAPAPTATLPPTPTPSPPPQTFDPAAPKFRISGRVTNAVNGAGVGNVDVSASFVESCCRVIGSATTDSNGNYSMTLPNGTYGVGFYPNPATGLAPIFWRSSLSFHQGTPLVVSGADQASVSAVLLTGALVSGRVTNGSGDPVFEANVIFRVIRGGHVRGIPTDTSGRYSFRLANGDYEISFYPPSADCCSGSPALRVPVSVRGSDVVVDGRVP